MVTANALIRQDFTTAWLLANREALVNSAGCLEGAKALNSGQWLQSWSNSGLERKKLNQVLQCGCC